MSETKHTPGPWVVGISSDNEIMSVNAPEFDGIEICEVWGEDDDKTITPMSTANARLIAAAPELLEALKDCRDLIENMPVEELLMQVKAAIAKAEGRVQE